MHFAACSGTELPGGHSSVWFSGSYWKGPGNRAISVVRKSGSKVTEVFVQKIGYARVSAQHQNLDQQLGALVAEGCDRVFQEKASGRSTMGRPQLEKAIAALGTRRRAGAAERNRATRSMLDGIQIIQRVAARGALVRSSTSRTWT